LHASERVRASASAERAAACVSISVAGERPLSTPEIAASSETDFTFSGRADERLRHTTHTPAEFAGALSLADCQMSGVPYSCVVGPDGRYKIPLANLRSRRTHQAVAEQCSGFWYVINSLSHNQFHYPVAFSQIIL